MKVANMPPNVNACSVVSNTHPRRKTVTRREKIIKCLNGIEDGQVKLQEHIQTYGTSGMSELLGWLCVGIRLLLEKELK